MKTKNLVAAVFLAPFSASLVLLIYTIAYSLLRSRYDRIVYDWLYASLFGVAVAFLATLTVGLPVHCVLSRLNRRKPMYYATVGGVVSLLPFVWIYILDDFRGVSVNTLLGYPLMAICCATMVSWVFAKIALRGSLQNAA